MDNQKNPGGLDKETTLGFDNADILAAKRRRSETEAAAPTSAVSANALRARMQSGQVQNKPQGKAAPASTARTGASQPPKPTQPYGAKPGMTSAPSVSRPKPAQAKPTMPGAMPSKAYPSTQKTNVSAPKTVAQAPKTASSAPNRVPSTPPRTNSASAPARPSASATAAGARPSMIPYKQMPVKKKYEAEAGATRVTDIRDVRAVAPVDDRTRLTDVKQMPIQQKKNIPLQVQDESEGANTIISVIKAITYIVAVIVVSVFLSMFIILVGNDVFAFVKDDTMIEVTIPEYATVGDIADILHENSLIEYPRIFEIYSGLNGNNSETEFVAGTYTVHPMMNYEELIEAFKKKAPSGISRITIPEGYTTDEIIDLLVSKNIGTREGYVDVINNYDFDYWFIDELEAKGVSENRFYRLDGYLFPDTYEFYNASSEEVVIGKLLKRFNQVFLDSYKQKAEELGYTVDEILIIASMIEKEAGSQSDFFDISSVFNNRLKAPANYPYLESDATVVYAIHHETGNRITPTDEDMVYESPYNTYTNKGLPPGPIANPSAGAIRAALYPSDTDYYFFYSESTYITHYSKTYEEHRKVIAEVQNKNNPAN